MNTLNTILISANAQNPITIIWIIVVLLSVAYLIYLFIKYCAIKRCTNKLSNEINLKKHDYDNINELYNDLQTKLNNKCYIFKHKNVELLIEKVNKINEFRHDLNSLQAYISSEDNYNSESIIKRYNTINEDYLFQEKCLFHSLCEQYYQQEKLLKGQFITKLNELTNIVADASKLTLKEFKEIDSLVKQLVAESQNSRYSEYNINVIKLKVSCKEFIQEAEKKERARQQAIIEAKLKTLNSDFSAAIKSKDIDNADKIQSVLNANIHKSNEQSLKDEFASINNDYNEQKQNGISVFEEECYVNYNIESIYNEAYPIMLTPQKGCIVWPHRRRQIARRGYKEEVFQKKLSKYISNVVSVLGDVNLLPASGCRPYEPDIAIVDLHSGANLRIDIEIDEPYAAISNKPTHYVGCGDEYRDTNINRLGWMVVRFSEYQVHTQPLECIAFICRIIKQVIPNINIPQELLSYSDPKREKQWEQLDAQKWAEEKCRQKYLNHEFGVVDKDELAPADTKLTTLEEEFKNKVKVPKISNPANDKYNNENKVSQDDEINFDTENHLYTYQGVEFKAVSTVISEFFPVFDQLYWAKRKARERGVSTQQIIEEWESKGNKSREIGTFLHSQIENYYLGKPIDYIYDFEYNGEYVTDRESCNIQTREFQYFINFEQDFKIKPYRTEWRIYCKRLKIAGTIDFLTKDGDEYYMFDWKRSDKVYKDNPWQYGLGELSHLQDTTRNHYCIQQNLYRWILENEYNITIGNMYLVVLHPTFNNYKIIEVPRMDEEVYYILNNI